jgi:UDP-glucose 4-epimerase
VKIFVTGHTGFVGRHLISRLRAAEYEVVVPGGRIELQNIASLVDHFSGCDVVFHCAGFAHADDDGSRQFAEQHWAINYQGAVNVAEAAVKAKVKRLIFVSTSKAVADAPEILIDEKFNAEPTSAYGKAKRAAEEMLQKICAANYIELVIIRPVMIYGRDGKGNLLRMWNAVQRNRFPPLPEGGARSLVHIDDVVEALLLSATSPKAAGQTYILAHPEPVNTRGIYLLMRKLCGMSEISWFIPDSLLKLLAVIGDLAGVLLKKSVPFNRSVYQKLMQPAVYSADKISQHLGWKPRVGIEAGLRSMQ